MVKQIRTSSRLFHSKRTLLKSGVRGIRFPGRSQLLAAVLLVLVLGPIFVTLRPTWGLNPSDALSMSVAENVSLLKNGYADVNIVYNVSDSHLADMYRQMFAAPSDAGVGEQMPIPESKVESGIIMPVKEEFYKSVKEEQQVSFGFRTWIDDSSMIPRGENSECLVSIDATSAPQIVNSTIFGSGALVEVAVGPIDDNATDKAIETAFNKVIFAQSLLRSLNETGPYECDWTTRITVPPGAELLNGYDLAGTSWLVDFGGGTSLSALLSLGGQPSTIVLDERTTVTTGNFTTSPEELYQDLLDYKVFKIKYLLENTSWTGQANTGAGEPGDWSASINWNWSDTYVFNYTQSFTSQDNGTKGLRAFVNVTVKVTPEFDFSAFIGWEAEHWYGGFKWFEAWISPRASCDVYVYAYTNASYSTDWSDTIPLLFIPFDFQIGPIPVILTLRLDLIPRLSFSAKGYILFEVEAKASVGFKAGAHYDADNGWSPIWESQLDATHTTPIIKADITITISPKIDLRSSLLLYDTVGPYLIIEVYGTAIASFDMDTSVGMYLLKWNFTIGLKITFGVRFQSNWLTRLFHLANVDWNTSWTKDLYTWKGQFGTNPCNVSIAKVDPNDVTTPGGDPIEVTGSVTSKYQGDKSGEVAVEYSKDNATWSAGKSVQCNKDGNFTIKWYPTIEVQAGRYAFWLRATYGGNNHLSSAIQPSNYSALKLVVLGGSDPYNDTNYVSDQALCKDIYNWDDPATVESWYPGYNVGYYSYYWGYRDPGPGSLGTSNIFYADDPYVYSWLKMVHIVEDTNIQAVPWIYWNLYDPWGNLVEHVADISNTYTKTPLYESQGGMLPDWWTPTKTPIINGEHVLAACIPYASSLQTDAYANLVRPGTLTPLDNKNVWPEWSCYARFEINSSWADKGPCRIEVVTSLEPYQSVTDTHQSQVVFNQTFTVIRHTTETKMLNPWTYDQFQAYSDYSYAEYGGYFNFSVRTNGIDSRYDLTGLGMVTIQYSTDGGMSWIDDWTGNFYWLPWSTGPYGGMGTYYAFKADSPGDYLVRARWDPDPRADNPYVETKLYGSSTSDPVHLVVYTIPTRIPSPGPTLSSPNVILGASVNITGRLCYVNLTSHDPYAPTIDLNYIPLGGKNVSIEYAFFNYSTYKSSDWYRLAMVATDDNGEFTFSWTPTSINSYLIRAHFYSDVPYNETDKEAGYYGSSNGIFSVYPGYPTDVQVTQGAKARVERAAGSVQFQAIVGGGPGRLSGLNCPEGAVEFFVYDPTHGYGELVGIDNDTDGDGYYTCTWDPVNWPYIGAMQWSAYFIGTPGEYADSMANSTVDVWRSQVDISVSMDKITLKPGDDTSIEVTLTMNQGVPDTFNLSIEGLHTNWYKFSNDSVSLDPPLIDSGTVTLEVSLPIIQNPRDLRSRDQPCLMNNPFTIVAKSTLDPFSNDSKACVLNVNFKPSPLLIPTGGLGVFVEPKTISITAPDTFRLGNTRSIYPTIPFTANVTVTNDESFTDVVLAEINVYGIRTPNQADLSWFNWTSIRIFMPPHSQYTIGLQGVINVADLVSQNLSLTELTRMFHATANSTVWDKGSASDTCTITVFNIQYDQEAHITVTLIDRQINVPGKKALFSVFVTSTIVEDQNVKLTISGDAGLGFNWTTQELVLPAVRPLVSNSLQYDLSVTFLGTNTGNLRFTILDEAWALSLTHDEALNLGLIETNSYTEYVQVTPQAILPGASFTYSPSMPLAGDTVAFDASASTAANKTIVSYAWDFGDSSITTTTNPIITHAYSVGGTYTVNLTITDTDGLTNSTYQTLAVYVQITFNQAGVGSDFSGTMLTVDGVAYGVTDLPETFTWAGSTTHDIAYQSPLVVGFGAKQYDWSSTSGMSELQSGSVDLTTSGSITGNYLTLVHDVTVTSIIADPTWVFQGQTTNVSVTVRNKGDFAENVTVTLYFNITLNRIVGIQHVSLLAGENDTLLFAWNTSGIAYNRNYTLAAVATIPIDVSPADNTLVNGTITVRIMGDVSGDGKVDIRDVASAARYYGTIPGMPNWNPNLDVNRDGKIDLRDLVLIARNFGKS